MTQLLPFFIILLVGIFFSEVFKRLHLPWVIALIIGGIIVGPFGLDVFNPNSTIEFIADIGLVFLMFMAGLETKFSVFKEHKKEIAELAILNSLVPLAVGVGIGVLFGFDLIPSLLIGIIFVSSSIAVVIPSLEANGLMHSRMGRSIVAATMVEDVLSLVFLSVLLQVIEPVANLPLPVFYVILFAVLFLLRWALPKLMWLLKKEKESEGDFFQQEVRVVFAMLIGTVVAFELLGLHPIIAGFFAGLVLSESIESEILLGKIRTLSYGFFIPTFFVVIGTKTNIGVFADVDKALLITVVLILGSIIAKFSSGWVGGKLLGFNSKESSVVGASTIPQLSTTLAVVSTGQAMGLLSAELVTALIVLSIVTTFAGPVIIKSASDKLKVDMGASTS